MQDDIALLKKRLPDLYVKALLIIADVQHSLDRKGWKKHSEYNSWVIVAKILNNEFSRTTLQRGC
jgi:hypothetical protein